MAISILERKALAGRAGKRDIARDVFDRCLSVFGRSRLAVSGAVLLVALSVVVLLAPHIVPHDPFEQSLANRLRPPGWVNAEGRMHLAGTDHFGRDLLARVLVGGRISLFVGVTSVALSLTVGLVIGLIAGYVGGPVEDGLMRIAEIQLALPFVLLALMIIALIGPGTFKIVLVFASTGWVVHAKVVRASTLSLRESDFVTAARALGCSGPRIVVRHILPNLMTPLLVIASVQVAQVIIYESAFGFFGLGVPPPHPSWGNMLSEGREYLYDAWWMGVFPGVAIVLTALGANLIGDGFRELFDPRENVGRI